MVTFDNDSVHGTLAAIGAYLASDAIQARALATEIEDAIEGINLASRDEI